MQAAISLPAKCPTMKKEIGGEEGNLLRACHSEASFIFFSHPRVARGCAKAGRPGFQSWAWALGRRQGTLHGGHSECKRCAGCFLRLMFLHSLQAAPWSAGLRAVYLELLGLVGGTQVPSSIPGAVGTPPRRCKSGWTFLIRSLAFLLAPPPSFPEAGRSSFVLMHRGARSIGRM